MRSADEAMRHFVQSMLAGLLTLAKLARRFPGDIVEDAPERSEAVPARLQCNVDDRKVGVAKKRPCTLDPACQEIAVRRQSEGALEGSGEVRLRYPADLGKPADGPFLVKGRVHSILGTKEPTQQQRFPADQSYLASFR